MVLCMVEGCCKNKIIQSTCRREYACFGIDQATAAKSNIEDPQ